jgi:hypothetical protein
MKKLLMLVLVLSSFIVVQASGIENPANPSPPNMAGKISLKEFVKLSPKEVEKLTGKKLKLREKIGLKIFQWKMKRKLKENEPVDPKLLKLGRLSLIFGIIALVFIFIPVGVIALLGLGCAIAGLVLGIKSLKGNSNVPGLLGVIFSSLVLVMLLVAIAVVAAWGWY